MRIFLFYIATSICAVADQSPIAFMKAWVEAYNKNNANAIIACYDQSEKTECLVSNGMWFKGYEDIRKMYQQDMKAIRFYDSVAEGMKQRILGEVAVVSFVHRFKYLIHETDVHYRIHIRTTATLKKHGDSWKIVSEHSSPIKDIERAKVIEPKKNDSP